MSTIKVMVNGLPGNLARSVAEYLIADGRFELVPHSLTGPEIQESEYIIDNIPVKLIRADQRNSQIEQIKQSLGEFLSVDYTHPSAVNPNAEFYCWDSLPELPQQVGFCCMGGQGTLPKEQKTQQSPGLGRSISAQFTHS